MTKEQLDRISELTRLSRSRDLTSAEQAEREMLRAQYIGEFRSNMKQILDNTTVQRPDGTVEPLRGKTH